MKWILLIVAFLSASVQANCNIESSLLNPNYNAIKAESDAQNLGDTEFFILVYSNSPRFCKYAESRGFADKLKFQCESDNDFGWVVHGLWAENKQSFIDQKKDGHPRWCEGDLDPEPLETLIPYLCMSPGTALLQGEWEKHGACDFDTAEEYFSQTSSLHNALELPPKEYDTTQAIEWMIANNQSITESNIVNMKHEFAICYDTELNLMSCPQE
ncbi:hypothetical protein L4D20_04360 [Vibrio kyushuensis]|uniref:ribonuclease T2 family protein n=1 Tax=Vibrio kyushuensis TaxID=2910249 RepID=UPI003D15067B